MGRIAGSCGSRSPWGTRPRRSPYNDTLGICFAYQKYLTVTMPGVSQKFPQKSCAELPATAPSGDPYGSARDNGCYPLAESLVPGARLGTKVRPELSAAPDTKVTCVLR